ncbi:CoA-disulfide reductase [Nocardioides marmoriginsengisoli]|uniref:CoA-disulfide reductase n=1 Tax=Nocardioides marmoriginsengisoli TaxID=661483 RepID=A0A3N0CB55_9ACTN|nr:FAD-dependent oxidoreductase [Nocardioides marmoriginsengisoli]RNL60682.1 CoA-disulfide reductase [Nocardioides marmoriginsengisoli]
MTQPRRTVIVGGVAGGMSAATRLRRLNEGDEIVVLERGPHVSFANCGLPYLVGGVIEDEGDVLLQTPGSLAARFGLDVRVEHEVVGVDAGQRTVTVRDLATRTDFDLAYDNLVLSTGAAPVRPDLPGIDRALTCRDLDDVARIIASIDSGARTAAVIGAGFIGLEVTENLVRRGLAVTLLEAAPQVLGPVDVEMAAPVEERLRAAGVTVLTGVRVVSVSDDAVVLADGTRVAADLVLLSAGVRPESSLAVSAGVEVSATGAIYVDDGQRTNVANIYAVGDAVAKRSPYGLREVPLANTANLQGRRVADVLSGHEPQGRMTRGTAIVEVLGTVVAMTGDSERVCRLRGDEIRVLHSHPFDHAGYYPGAEQMALKLVVDAASDAILGAQAVGGAGVDKRIDVISTAMAAGIRASDLAGLELAYAPQFGSAKDPVNMLGYMAENLRDGRSRTVQWHGLDDEVAAGAQLVDVRTVAEFARGALPGAVNLPLDELRDRLAEVGPRVVVYCAVGQRGHVAARILAQHGIEVSNLDGGIRTRLAASGRLPSWRS